MTHSALRLLAALMLIPMGAVAQESTRTVTVTGRSEIRVTPDKVIVKFAAETADDSLTLAKQENDRIVTEAIDIVKELGVSAGNVKTDHLKVEPIYSGHKAHSRSIEGYRVTSTVVVESQDVSRVNQLITALLEAGVNRIMSIDYRSDGFRSHRDKAMLMALDAAKEKARAMAEHLGLRIGGPVSVDENVSRGLMVSGMSNSMMREPTIGDWANGPLAPGELSIPAKVTVVFELVD